MDIILTHLLLSISDKIRFECVSKQWQRFIFNKQNKLLINRSENNKDVKCTLTSRLIGSWGKTVIKYTVSPILFQRNILYESSQYMRHIHKYL
jgi:hypothetical protein